MKNLLSLFIVFNTIMVVVLSCLGNFLGAFFLGISTILLIIVLAFEDMLDTLPLEEDDDD